MSSLHSNPMPSISTIHKALADFQLSPSTFRILYSIPSSSLSCSAPQPPSSPPPKTLYVLDSSFNPPTVAHLEMATSALHSHRHRYHASSPSTRSSPSPCRRHLLLLLATQNADKQFGPASFERRLAMMGLLAEEIARKVGGARGRRKMKAESSTSLRLPPRSPICSSDDENDLESGDVVESEENIDNNTGDNGVTVDIGVTKKPYFHDKAAAITTSGAYSDYAPLSDGGGGGEETKMEQVYLVGFDTLIRLLNPKYYPPSRTSLHDLDPFFGSSRVRVTRRAGGDYGHGKGSNAGSSDPQDEYVRALAAGEREGEGGRRAWAQRIQLVESSGEENETEEQMISSTKVREAMKRGDEGVMKRLVPGEVGRFILDQGIYRQDG